MPQPRYVARAAQIIPKTFNTTATVSRKTSVADNYGGFRDTYAAIGTYPCSYSRYAVTPRERENTVTVEFIAIWTFVFALGTDIRHTDRIAADGRQFEVTSPSGGSLEVATRVLCTEVT